MPYWVRKVCNESSFEEYGGLYTFSSLIIVTGFLNILLIHVDVGEELLDIDTPTPQSSFMISGKITPDDNYGNDSESIPNIQSVILEYIEDDKSQEDDESKDIKVEKTETS